MSYPEFPGWFNPLIHLVLQPNLYVTATVQGNVLIYFNVTILFHPFIYITKYAFTQESH